MCHLSLSPFCHISLDWCDKSIFWHYKSGDINAVNKLNKLKISYLITHVKQICTSAKTKKQKFSGLRYSE